MHDGDLKLVTENLLCQILDFPSNQGSRTMVNAFEGASADGGNCWRGWKVRRNEASPLRCLTVKDILKSLQQAIQQI